MSDTKKLTQEEAESLLNMLKKTLIEEISFPSKGQAIEFRFANSIILKTARHSTAGQQLNNIFTQAADRVHTTVSESCGRSG